MEKRTDGSMKKFLEGTYFFYQADNYDGGSAGYTFAPIDGGTAYAVTGFTSQESDIVIPDSYNGLPIKQISPNAFADKEHLTSVIMRDSITLLATSAFVRCRNLRAVFFSEGIECFCDGVFEGCTALTSVKLPPRLIDMTGYAFYRCSSLRRVIIPKSIRLIGYKSFEGCDSLREVFYEGSKEDWGWVRVQPNDALMRAKLYYYSEREPLEKGEYWHYAMNGEPIIW